MTEEYEGHRCKRCGATDAGPAFLGFHAKGDSEVCDHCAEAYGCDCDCFMDPDAKEEKFRRELGTVHFYVRTHQPPTAADVLRQVRKLAEYQEGWTEEQIFKLVDGFLEEEEHRARLTR